MSRQLNPRPNSTAAERNAYENLMQFLHRLETGMMVMSTVPLVNESNARIIAMYLDAGRVSARRMARALDASFEDMDATFAHHGLEYRLGR